MKCAPEAAAVLAALVAPPRLNKSSETAPPAARRVRHDRVRASVQPRVSLSVPRVDALEPEVAPTRLDVERSDHRCLLAAGRLRFMARTIRVDRSRTAAAFP